MYTLSILQGGREIVFEKSLALVHQTQVKREKNTEESITVKKKSSVKYKRKKKQ